MPIRALVRFFVLMLIPRANRLVQRRNKIGCVDFCGHWSVAVYIRLIDRQRMRFEPQRASRDRRIYADTSPPRRFVAAAVDLAMMSSTERNRELIAHLAAERRGWAKRRWWASAGRRSQTKHGCLATDLTWFRSRTRRGSGIESALLLISLGRLRLSDALLCRCCAAEACSGRCTAGAASSGGFAKPASLAAKTSSTR